MMIRTAAFAALATISGQAFSGDTWWNYHISQERCVASPTGDMHPKEIHNIVREAGGSIKVLGEEPDAGLYIFQMKLPGESPSIQSMANTYAGCEKLGEMARQSGLK